MFERERACVCNKMGMTDDHGLEHDAVFICCCAEICRGCSAHYDLILHELLDEGALPDRTWVRWVWPFRGNIM